MTDEIKVGSRKEVNPTGIPFCRLHKTQNLLYESTRDFLQLKFDARANEKAWMAEKDSLLRKLRKDLDHLVFSTESGKMKQRELKKMIQEDDGTSKLHSREIKVFFLSLIEAAKQFLTRKLQAPWPLHNRQSLAAFSKLYWIALSYVVVGI